MDEIMVYIENLTSEVNLSLSSSEKKKKVNILLLAL